LSILPQWETTEVSTTCSAMQRILVCSCSDTSRTSTSTLQQAQDDLDTDTSYKYEQEDFKTSKVLDTDAGMGQGCPSMVSQVPSGFNMFGDDRILRTANSFGTATTVSMNTNSFDVESDFDDDDDDDDDDDSITFNTNEPQAPSPRRLEEPKYTGSWQNAIESIYSVPMYSARPHNTSRLRTRSDTNRVGKAFPFHYLTCNISAFESTYIAARKEKGKNYISAFSRVQRV
jgi:hypothetical protein